ncbi:uncharacterized protein LOC141909218 [Tubulanus polymorphus]|uniref:uncharacterized protein LOC141909218 n=1 Tax=Tubulanus polymorphus TaxID=672921 RepID=UPI003DA2FFAF
MAEGGHNRNASAGMNKDEYQRVTPSKVNLDRSTGNYSAEVNAASGNQKGKMKMDINVKVNGNKTVPKVNNQPRDDTKKKAKKSDDEKVTIDLKFTINVKNGKQKTTVTPAKTHRNDDDDDEGGHDDEDTEVEENDETFHGQASRDSGATSAGAVGGVHQSRSSGGHYDDDLGQISDLSVRSEAENSQNDYHKKRFDCLSGYDSGIHESHTDRGHSDTLVEESDGCQTPNLEDSQHSSERKTKVQRSQSQIRKNRAQKLKQALEREDSGESRHHKDRRRASISDGQHYHSSTSLSRRPSFTNTHTSILMHGASSESEDSIDDETKREHLDTFIMLYKLKSFLKQNLPSPGRRRSLPQRHDSEDVATDSVFSDGDDTGLIRSAVVNVVHSQNGGPINLPDGSTITQSSTSNRDPLDKSKNDVPPYDGNSNLTGGLLKPSQTQRSQEGELESRGRSPSFRETLEHFIKHNDEPNVQKLRNPSVMETVGDMIHSGGGNFVGSSSAQCGGDDDVFVNEERPTPTIKTKMSNFDGRAEKLHHETVDVDPRGKSKAEIIFSEPEDLANIDPHAIGIDLKDGEQLKYMEVIVVDAEDANGRSASTSSQVFQPIGILPYTDENEALIDKEINEFSQNAGYMVSSSPLMTRSLPNSPKIRAKSFHIMRKISGGEYPKSPDDVPMSPARRAISVAEGPPRSPRTTRKTSTVDFYKQFYGKTKRQLAPPPDVETCTPIERSHSNVIDQLDGLQFQKALRGESIEGLGCMHRGHAGFIRGSNQSLDSHDESLSATSDESRVFVFPDTNMSKSKPRSNESSISDASSDVMTSSPQMRTRRNGMHSRPPQPDYSEFDDSEFIRSVTGRKTSSGSGDGGSSNRSSLELREVAQLQSPEARASPPVFRGLRKMTPNQQPDVSKLRNHRQEAHPTSGPVNARDQRNSRGETENRAKRSSADEYRPDVGASTYGSKVLSPSPSAKTSLPVKHEGFENAFDTLADDIDQLDIAESKSKKRIAKFTGEDWILKTKHQVQEMATAEQSSPLKTQVSNETHSKNLQGPLEEDGNSVAPSSSGGLSVDVDYYVAPYRRISAPEHSLKTSSASPTVDRRNNSSVSRKSSAPAATAAVFKSYVSRDEKDARERQQHQQQQRQRNPETSPQSRISNEPGNRKTSSNRSSPLLIPPLWLSSSTDVNIDTGRTDDAQFISRMTPPSSKSERRPSPAGRAEAKLSDTKPPSPFRSYRSPLEFDTPDDKPEKLPSPLTLTSVAPTAVKRVPPLTPRSAASFQPYQSSTAPKLRASLSQPTANDRTFSESEFLSPRMMKSGQLESTSSFDSGFNGSIRPDRLNSTYSDVFRSSDHFGDLEDTATEEGGYLSDGTTPRYNAAGSTSKPRYDTTDGEDTARTVDEPVEFEQMMSRLFEEEDYQSDDEGLRQKCLDVFKTIHHQDTVFSEFRKLLRFKRRNSVQKGPIKGQHPPVSNGIYSSSPPHD